MWRAKRIETGNQIVLRLSGRLDREQLSELKDALASHAPIHHLILDLTDVKLVDQDTVYFLADCEAAGARLWNCPAYIRVWIADCRAARKSISG